MRKVILSTHITLDGYMAGPNGELDWHQQNWNNEVGEFAFQQLSTVDTILVGRVMYQSMANFWPSAFKKSGSQRKDVAFANMMNTYTKIVFSRKLSTVTWNNSRLVKDHIADEITKLKQQPGKDMIIWGGFGIVQTFIQLGLIDEYRLSVAPVLIGDGLPLFQDTRSRLHLKLLSTRLFSNGVVLLCYRPK